MLLAQHLIINQRPIAAFSARPPIDFLQSYHQLGGSRIGRQWSSFHSWGYREPKKTSLIKKNSHKSGFGLGNA
jgi:hypothetical protein